MTKLDKTSEQAQAKTAEVKQKVVKAEKSVPNTRNKTSKATKNMKTIEIKLIKSLIGRLPKHRKCVYGLGLRRIGQKVEVLDTSANRGMINKVDYLLEVEE